MNWIERLYELKRNDHYSQNSEGIYLEYVFHCIKEGQRAMYYLDIGGGDGFYLSNTKHLSNLGWRGLIFDKENDVFITRENVNDYIESNTTADIDLLSIDIDGNDYHIIKEVLKKHSPSVIIAEFNPAFGDSRTIKYNPDHVWDGTDYYGFSFHAGVKLAEDCGYEVVFQIANMNMIMVRKDLIKVPIPPVTFRLNNFFKRSERPESDWVFI